MPRIVTAPNRGTVHVVAGVLSGIGPSGPEGPAGPPGPATTITAPSFATYNALLAAYPSDPSTEGLAHIVQEDGCLYRWNSDTSQWQNVGRVVGEPGQVQSVIAQFSSDTIQSVSRTTWKTLAFDTEDINNSTVYIDPATGTQTTEKTVDQLSATSFAVPHGRDEAYIVIARAIMVEGGSATPGQRKLRLLVAGQTISTDTTVSEGSAQGTTELELVAAWSLSSGTPFQVDIWHDSVVPANVEFAQITVIRVGGGVGPQGPQGVIGPQGLQGPKGDAGSAGSGYTTGDDMTADVDAELAPTVGTPRTTTEQRFPTASGDQRPNVPYFIHTLATALERFVVARFPDEATFTARSSPSPGEVGYLTDTATTVVRTGAARTSTVAYITSGESALVDGSASTEPDGTLYVQYTVT
jgi:hypothetical protein